ncbi:MAG TPA: adenosylcobinamide-GDP ribazoletransferase, partial [Nocardioidaceae bacterium]|nr:adenosylcobinamide-GDP ribazoletransferase [Nocardioidaceae bacterium]
LEALLLLRPAPPLLVAALTIGLLAVLTRAIHLDGLADTADGLGSGRPAEQALDVMRRSDIGPFGVVTLVLVLLVQVSALGALVDDGRGSFAIVLALVLSRLALPLVCLQRIPAARPDGLGHTVAASVSPAKLMLAGVLGCLAVLGFVAVTLGLGTMSRDGADLVVSAVLAAVLALAAGAAMCWWCVRRLGGVTGDVLGACVEVTFTVALVVLTLV